MHATIHVFTYREGLLGKLGHDLRLTLGRFTVTARGNEVTGRFEPASLRAEGAVKNGKLEPGELSPSDRQKIQESIRDDVLRTREFPEATFTARTSNKAPPFTLDGRLTLCGVTHPLSLKLEDQRGRLAGCIEIKPSEWGIKPFRALGGALKVQDRVTICIDASADWLHAGATLNPAVELTWTGGDPSSPPARR